MLNVRLFSDFGDSQFLLNHLKNQTPGFIGDTYKNLNFVCDDSYTHAVCFNRPVEKLKSPKENNIGFLMDLPFIYKPHMDSLGQIGRYFCWYKECKPQIQDIYLDIPFSYMFYHTPILSTNDCSKKHRMSMVVSGKMQTEAQYKRIQIVEKLLEKSVDIHFYGRNFSIGQDVRIKGSLPFMEKQKALIDYQYSICLENLVYDGWLTEKFYDCIINNCVPVTNSLTANSQINNKSFCFLNFSKSVTEIVDDILDIYYNDTFDLRINDLLLTKEDVINGKFSICEKISQELH